MTAQLVEIELPAVESSFYCPVCGAAIATEETPEGVCPHLLFYLNQHAGVLDRLSPKLEEARQFLEEAEDWTLWPAVLPDTAVVFCFLVAQQGPMAGDANYYCIDFAAEQEEG